MAASPWKCASCALVNAAEVEACRRCSSARATALRRDSNPYAPPRAAAVFPLEATPVAAATAADPIVGPVYSDSGFKTWWIVSHDDALVFVRAPWFLGLPGLLAFLLPVAALWAIARVTLSGRAHWTAGEVVFTIAAIGAVVAFVRVWPRLVREWRARMVGTSTADLAASGETLVFPWATLRGVRREGRSSFAVENDGVVSTFGLWMQSSLAELEKACAARLRK